VVVPIASGNLYVKILKGLEEMVAVGLIPRAHTKIHGAQAEGCSPVATAFRTGAPVRPVKPNTIAHSLAIGTPADGRYAIEVSKQTGGIIDAVSDDEIIDGIRLLAEQEGMFTETAGGVTIATLRRLAAEGHIDPDGTTVAYITGMGLKTSDAVSDRLAAPIRIRPSLRAFEQAVLSGVTG
jgi:threonine synthase